MFLVYHSPVFCWLLLVLFDVASTQINPLHPNPIPFTGPAATNPPNSLLYQDISIIRRVSDGTYFRFSKSNSTGLGLSVATSPTLRGPWKYSYAALSGPLKDPSAANRSAINLWSPEVHYVNSTYYLYYGINWPLQGVKAFDIAVATSLDLTEGSWVDHGSVNIPPAPNPDKPEREYVRLGVTILANGSDPSGIDTKYKYLTFDSYNHGLYGVALADDLLTIAPGAIPTEVIADQLNPGDGNNHLEGNKTEAAYQLHYGDYIYGFYSIGSCCAGGNAGADAVYRVQVCRTNYTDGPDGPFFDRNGINCLTGPVNRTGTTVVATHSNNQVFAPGSIGILRDPVEGLVMTYQYKNLTAEDHSLRFGYNYLGFDEEKWPVLLAKKMMA